MVSRRNFLTMILTMLILFFMFQFTGMAKNVLNEYNTNEYVKSALTDWKADSMYRADSLAEIESPLGERPYILFAGDGNSEDIRQTTAWWCTYTKRAMEECTDLSAYRFLEETQPQAVVIDGESLKLETDLPVLKEMADRGIHLIFARLPDVEVLMGNQEFRDFIGIRNVFQESVEVDGIHVFQGFLLGGEKIYEVDPDAEPEEKEKQDLELIMPWYMTGSGTKTYIMGMVGEKDEYQNEMLPAIVWRKSVGEAKIFCVNADYMSHMYGMGFLSAMMAETGTYEIYPIVNAQNLSVVNFSAFADENSQQLDDLYSQPQPALYRELIWPALVSISYESKSRISLLTAPQLDYGDNIEPVSSELVYYLKLLKEEHGEAGFSLDLISDTPADEKIARDEVFYSTGAAEYQLLSLYAKNMEDLENIKGAEWLSGIRTVTTIPEDERPVIDYADENMTLQNATAVAEKHTFTDDLALMGMETALGYSNIVLDLQNVSYPRSKEDQWEKFARIISENICTYWQDYDCFTETTLSESDARIRRFLALDFRTESQNDKIILTSNDIDGSVWFLLKLNGKDIKQMEGGSIEEIGGGYYLIELNEAEAVIELKENQVNIYN